MKHRRPANPSKESDRPDMPVFQFRIDFDPAPKPRDFSKRLLGQVLSMGLDCYIGGLGGFSLSYGVVMGGRRDVTSADREAFAEWVRRQGMACRVALGDLEPFGESVITRDVTECVFHVEPAEGGR